MSLFVQCLNNTGRWKGFYKTHWHNKCEHVLDHMIFAAHPLPSSLLLLPSFNSCTLSAFGAVLSYTILRQATQPPFFSLLLLLFPVGPDSNFVHHLLIYLQAWSKSFHFLHQQKHTLLPSRISCSGSGVRGQASCIGSVALTVECLIQDSVFCKNIDN